MSGLNDTRPILVLGMHRSGTSAVARTLNLLGVALGDAHLPPQQDNPTGFWEHAEVIRIHEQILHALSHSWDGVRPLPAGWTRFGDVQPARAALVALLEHEFGGKPLWAVKDPRLSLLAPLWTEVLAERGCTPSFVIVLRDPREVAQSLLVRDETPPARGYLLWLRHTLGALAASRGHPWALLSYSDLLRDWRTELARVGSSLGVEWPDIAKGAEAADEFLSPRLRHHVAQSALAEDRQVPEWIRDTYAALCDAEIDDAGLERVERALANADDLLGLELESRDAAITRLASHERDALLRVSELEERETQLYAQLEISQKEGVSLWHGTQSLERDLAAARGALEERAAQLERTRQDQAEGQQEILRLTERRGAVQASLERSQQEAASLAEQAHAAQLEAERLREETSSLNAELERSRAEAKARREEDSETARELARAKSELTKRADELFARDKALAEATERRKVTQDGFVEARMDLEAEREALAELRASRSWRYSQPIRFVERLLGQEATPDSCGPVQSEIRPGGELLPGKPIRQEFRSPVSELSLLGVYFFTYHRVNSSRVRLRLLEKRLAGRERVVHEVIIEDEEVADGRVSRFELPKPLRRANIRQLVFEIESVDGVTGKTLAVGFTPSYYEGGDVIGAAEVAEDHVLALEFNPEPRCDINKSFAFVSGCPGDAFRYRCEHQAEALRFAGYTADVFDANSFPWSGMLRDYQVVVAHRVPHTKDFEKFVVRAQQAGVEVVFDSDDLVFDPSQVDRIDAVSQMTRDERELFINGVKRYRRTLELADRATMSTEALHASVLGVFPEKPAAIHRNVVSEDMRELADQALARPKPGDRAIRLAYFSGTNTHRRDFAECVPAVARILEEFPETRLMLAGHIEVPEELASFSSRIETHPFMDWRRLPALYRDVEVNLAPLEPGSLFTEAKSELKYLEAGLLEVPTVASRLGAFEIAIADGETGFLCAGEEEWFAAIRALVESPSLRREIGERAKADVEARYTTRAAAAGLAAQWASLVGNAAASERKLRVAWVLRAPIAQTGGGYKKIFQIANHLAGRGHEVDIYVEPIAHLKGLSQKEVEAFCYEHFGESSARIHVGHDEIRSSDVAVATNWPTAQVVDDLENTTLKTYFVQDFEPSFYLETDPLYQAAEETYDLPLRIISIGRYLADRLGERNNVQYPHVDFALGEEFFHERERVEEKLSGMGESGSCSILFFARPEIPRRCFHLGVEALERLHAACPEVEIRLYGMKEDRDLPFPYENLRLVEQQGVASAMRDADICLSFSATNASTVMFEAMASGSAAVELDQPGVRDLLDDPETCTLVANDPDAVAAALVELVRNPAKRAAIARSGNESVRHLSVENMAEQFERHLLSAVLGRRCYRDD